MEINGKKITGIFKYSEELIYNAGDFIVKDDNIYVCIKDGASGDPSKELSYYKPYIFHEEATWEEFEELYNLGSSNKDGIITSRMLSKVLKKLNFGIDSNGIITKEITKNYISPGLEEFTNNNINVLDQLILNIDNTELNNLTVKIDRSLPGCLITIKPTDDINDIDFKSVLLKQYTYRESTDDGTDSNKITYRIQELIDHIFGICFYRYVKLSEYSREGEISEWKQSSINDDYIKKLSGFYKIIKEKEKDVNRFGFKKIEVSDPYISGTEYQYSVNLENSDLITITVTSPITTDMNNNILESYSMTVKVDGNEYKFPNDIIVKCSNSSIVLNATANIKFSISDIYIRVNK